MKKMRRGFLLFALLLLTGCHGSKERVAFEVPEAFDTTRTYEITFSNNKLTQLKQSENAENVDGAQGSSNVVIP